MNCETQHFPVDVYAAVVAPQGRLCTTKLSQSATKDRFPLHEEDEDGEKRFKVPQPETQITVYVVAWQYNTGVGFDWYRRPGDADAAYEEEKGNADEMADEGWSAYRFDYVVSSKMSDEQITQLIDSELDDLYVKATEKHENVLDKYGKKLSEIKQSRGVVYKAVSFCYTNKSGGTNMIQCESPKLTQFQRLSARYKDQKVKWLAEFTIQKQWHDYETGGRMIGLPVNKELKAFLKRHAHPDKQVIYVSQHDLLR